MFALIGLGLSCAAVLLIGSMAVLRRHENTPQWAKANWVVQSLFYMAFAGLIFGVAILAGAIANSSSSDYGWLEAVLAVFILGATATMWWAVRRPLSSSQSKDKQAVSSGLEQPVVGEPTDPNKRNETRVKRQGQGRTRRTSAA